jgi:hypothetical protein
MKLNRQSPTKKRVSLGPPFGGQTSTHRRGWRKREKVEPAPVKVYYRYSAKQQAILDELGL